MLKFYTKYVVHNSKGLKKDKKNEYTFFVLLGKIFSLPEASSRYGSVTTRELFKKIYNLNFQWGIFCKELH